MPAQSLLDHLVAGASIPPLGGRVPTRPAAPPRRRRRLAATARPGSGR